MSDNHQSIAVIFKQITPRIRLASHFSSLKQEVIIASETATPPNQTMRGDSITAVLTGDAEKTLSFLDSPSSKAYGLGFSHEDKGVSTQDTYYPAGTRVIEVTLD